jgi:hypothetical protein
MNTNTNVSFAQTYNPAGILPTTPSAANAALNLIADRDAVVDKLEAKGWVFNAWTSEEDAEDQSALLSKRVSKSRTHYAEVTPGGLVCGIPLTQFLLGERR